MHNGHCVRVCARARPRLPSHIVHSRKDTTTMIIASIIFYRVQFFCLRHSRFACRRESRVATIKFFASNYRGCGQTDSNRSNKHTQNSALALSMTNRFACALVVSLFRFTAKVHTFTCAHASQLACICMYLFAIQRSIVFTKRLSI